MQTLLRRITLGIGTGAALAASSTGCATSLLVPEASDDADANGFTTDAANNMQAIDARVMEHVDATIAEHVDASALPDAMVDTGVATKLDSGAPLKDGSIDGGSLLSPFPLDAGCIEEDAGWCCYIPVCHVVAGSCPSADAPDSPTRPVPPHLAYCERFGPFAPNPDAPFPPWPDADGNCCYVVPSELSGEGRPFTTDGTHQVAPVVVRNDWLLA